MRCVFVLKHVILPSEQNNGGVAEGPAFPRHSDCDRNHTPAIVNNIILCVIHCCNHKR